ncbi:PASTA domain-containing protein [Acidipila sp. EB88]|uniref:PASTA domain-containing protein n=1 Tax=Acidipila sp. EB88 TaxID=2305226 RepID=UPI000F5F55B7|nr:PASTA domain-containing protein [Acidipila sp. EB88]RRA48677.1 PASTA domain-containing protein [Acidipila sp. EB88]
MIAYFRFALIAMLLAVIAGVSAIVTMQFAVHRAEVAVPDLKGLSLDAAISKAAERGLDVSVTERFYSTALPAGRVLLQTPGAGASVRRGWNLAVAESLGAQKIAIPDVVGKSERDALLLIRQQGLELGAVAHLPDARVPPGSVLAQDPAPEAKGAERPSMSLLVAAPQPADAPAWVMPDEQGKPYAEAAEALSKAGLQVESAAGAPPGAQITLSPATAAGTVVVQAPPAGARIDASTHVVLWVAGGSAPGSSPGTAAAVVTAGTPGR